MSTRETPAVGSEAGLRYWLPRLATALDDDPAGAGRQLREIIVGRSARIGLGSDVVLVRSVADGHLEVEPDDVGASPDGSGFTDVATVLALLDGEIEVNQAIISGDVEVRSTMVDALWMYRIIELLLDGASRVPELRRLADRFVAAHRRPPGSTGSTGFVDWREGGRETEIDLLDRLGLLEGQEVDHDA